MVLSNGGLHLAFGSCHQS